MATYIMLLRLTPEGRERFLDDAQSILRAESETKIPGVHTLGLYGVLGEYDFVSIIEAPDNEAAGKFSIQFGVKAGVSITTLPAIPVSRLDSAKPPVLRTAVAVGELSEADEPATSPEREVGER